MIIRLQLSKPHTQRVGASVPLPILPAKVIVMIPAYNEAESIGQTIDSLRHQTRCVQEIIVGDDLSTDRTAEIANEKGVVVVRHQKRNGNKAFNQQAIINSAEFQKMVKGEDPSNVIVVIIDGDTLIAPNGMEELIGVMERDPSVQAASGYVVPQETNTIWQRARLVEYHSSLNLQKDVQDRLGTNLVVSGCFAANRLSSILFHGGFDTRTISEDFGLTCEQNLNKEKVRFIKEAVCYTKEPPTYDVLMKQLDRWYGGFFQNIKIHREGILKFQNWRFTCLLMLLFSEGLYNVMLPLIFFTAAFYHQHIAYNFRFLLWYFLLLDIPMVVIPAVYGASKHSQVWLTVRSVPYFFVMRFMMAYVWWKCLFREWVQGRPLQVWNKGH